MLKKCDSSPGSSDECGTAPDGCTPLDQADRLSHKPACRLPVNCTHHHHSLLLSPKADTYFTVPRRAEGWLYIPRLFTRPQTVTHPSTNRARLTGLRVDRDQRATAYHT